MSHQDLSFFESKQHPFGSFWPIQWHIHKQVSWSSTEPSPPLVWMAHFVTTDPSDVMAAAELTLDEPSPPESGHWWGDIELPSCLHQSLPHVRIPLSPQGSLCCRNLCSEQSGGPLRFQIGQDTAVTSLKTLVPKTSGPESLVVLSSFSPTLEATSRFVRQCQWSNVYSNLQPGPFRRSP